jgi:hypothetical protein
MKKLLLLILLSFLSYTSISQSLKPKVQLIGKDTCFCFTLSQSKIIATELETHRYCDSVLVKTEKQVDAFNQLLTTKDSCLEIAQHELKNQKTVIENQDAYADAVTEDLQQTRKQYHNQRWQKELFIMTSFILGALTIIKHAL